MRKFLFLLMLWGFTFTTNADSKIKRYETKVNNYCSKTEGINSLLIKKSLIELVKGGDCTSRFTTIVINKCDQLDCSKITEIYRNIRQVRAGSVVGDEQ